MLWNSVVIKARNQMNAGKVLLIEMTQLATSCEVKGWTRVQEQEAVGSGPGPIMWKGRWVGDWAASTVGSKPKATGIVRESSSHLLLTYTLILRWTLGLGHVNPVLGGPSLWYKQGSYTIFLMAVSDNFYPNMILIQLCTPRVSVHLDRFPLYFHK